MSVEDDLRRFVGGAPSPSQGRADPSVAARVEELLTELELKWSVDEDGDWLVDTDEGPVVLLLGPESLTFIHHLHELGGKAKRHANYFELLLAWNAQDDTSAAFCLSYPAGHGAGDRVVGIKSEIAVANLDKAEVALSLKSVLSLSYEWSKQIGNDLLS